MAFPRLGSGQAPPTFRTKISVGDFALSERSESKGLPADFEGSLPAEVLSPQSIKKLRSFSTPFAVGRGLVLSSPAAPACLPQAGRWETDTFLVAGATGLDVRGKST